MKGKDVVRTVLHSGPLQLQAEENVLWKLYYSSDITINCVYCNSGPLARNFRSAEVTSVDEKKQQRRHGLEQPVLLKCLSVCQCVLCLHACLPAYSRCCKSKSC